MSASWCVHNLIGLEGGFQYLKLRTFASNPGTLELEALGLVPCEEPALEPGPTEDREREPVASAPS